MKKRILLMLAAVLMMLLSSCIPTANIAPSGPPVFKLEELPDIGEYSGKPSVRFHEKASDEFVPDENYGTLVPFIGRIKEFDGNSFGADISMSYSKMGLCTTDGQIVVEPFDGYITYNDYYEAFPYYELIPYSDEAAEMMMQPDSVMLPVDGSWKMSLPSGAWLCGAGEGIISVLVSDPETYEFRGLECFDYDGNKLFDVPKVWSAQGFSQGYAPVNIGQDERNACYIDKNGNVVSDFYTICSAFNENGVAYVQEYNGCAYLINTSFERISEIYDNIFFYDEKYITARSNYGHCDIISGDGKVIASVESSGFVNLYGNDENLIYSYYNGFEDVYCNLDGTLFVNEEGYIPNTFVQERGYFSYKDSVYNIQTLFDSTGKILARFEDCNSIISVLEEENLVIYTKGNYDFEEFENGRPIYSNPIRTAIYDLDEQKDLLVLDGQGGVYPAGKDDRYLLISIYSDYDFGGSTRYCLFDTKTHKLVFSDCLMIDYYDIENGYFVVGNDSFCTLYDSELKPVLRLINE